MHRLWSHWYIIYERNTRNLARLRVSPFVDCEEAAKNCQDRIPGL